MKDRNIIINCDGYKPSHAYQLPKGTTHISSYLSARAAGLNQENGLPLDRSLFVTFFGLQAFIKEYLMKPITLGDIAEAEEFFEQQGAPFDSSMWMHILKAHGGKLPLSIQAIPEGTLVPVGVPMVQIVNTDPLCASLTSFIETALLRAVWYPSTVATLSTVCVEMIRDFLMITGTPDLSSYKLVDFGQRGSSSMESASIGGAAHLLNSSVTDTMNGVRFAQRYYDAEICDTTIPATEHSTMTCWEHEVDAVANMIDRFGSGMFAVVIDSYDDENFVKEICGKTLRNKIDALPDRGGVMIFRPDSGDAMTHPIEVMEWLGETFGTTNNEKGFKLLPQHIRVIQGDGMTPSTLLQLLNNIAEAGWSVDNISFGMGGGLLQGSEDWMVSRDTHRFAMKANLIKGADGERAIQKRPKTDPTKASISGRTHVYSTGTCADIQWCPEDEFESLPEPRINMFKEVFLNGELLVNEDFYTVCNRLETCKSELRSLIPNLGDK